MKKNLPIFIFTLGLLLFASTFLLMAFAPREDKIITNQWDEKELRWIRIEWKILSTDRINGKKINHCEYLRGWFEYESSMINPDRNRYKISDAPWGIVESIDELASLQEVVDVDDKRIRMKFNTDKARKG